METGIALCYCCDHLNKPSVHTCSFINSGFRSQLYMLRPITNLLLEPVVLYLRTGHSCIIEIITPSCIKPGRHRCRKMRNRRCRRTVTPHPATNTAAAIHNIPHGSPHSQKLAPACSRAALIIMPPFSHSLISTPYIPAALFSRHPVVQVHLVRVNYPLLTLPSHIIL